MPDPDEPDDGDSQDLAEVFDEENITRDGRDIATSDMERDVFDVTATLEDGDLDDVRGPEDDFDPDEMDEVEYEEVVMGDEDLDTPRITPRDRANLVSTDDLSPADMEPDDLNDEDLAALGYADAEPDPAEARRRHLDRELDEALAETFPASDPVAVSGAD